MGRDQSRPAPEETGRGQQKDDNIDDLGRKPDGSSHEQPADPQDGKDADESPPQRHSAQG